MVRLKNSRFDCVATIATPLVVSIGTEADRRLAARIPREIEVRE